MGPTPIERGAFSGHETFPLRYTWLTKAVRHATRNPAIFSADDAIVRLGVGKNMVKSMRYWATALGVLESAGDREGVKPTVLGMSLFAEDGGWDPFFEDPATLWWAHWQLASKPTPCTTWFWTFNHVPQPEFTRDELVRWILTLARQEGWSRITEASLKRDIDVFLRTYVPSKPSRTAPIEDTLDCPLIELRLVRETGIRGHFALHRARRESLPPGVFAYALAEFLERTLLATRTVPLHTLALAPGSPGRVFGLSEDGLIEQLEALDSYTKGALTFDETAGLRQLQVRTIPKAHRLLEAHYRGTAKSKGRS